MDITKKKLTKQRKHFHIVYTFVCISICAIVDQCYKETLYQILSLGEIIKGGGIGFIFILFKRIIQFVNLDIFLLFKFTI